MGADGLLAGVQRERRAALPRPLAARVRRLRRADRALPSRAAAADRPAPAVLAAAHPPAGLRSTARAVAALTPWRLSSAYSHHRLKRSDRDEPGAAAPGRRAYRLRRRLASEHLDRCHPYALTGPRRAATYLCRRDRRRSLSEVRPRRPSGGK